MVLAGIEDWKRRATAKKRIKADAVDDEKGDAMGEEVGETKRVGMEGGKGIYGGS